MVHLHTHASMSIICHPIGAPFSISTYTHAHMHHTGSVQKAVRGEHGVPEEAVQREVPPLGEPEVKESDDDLLKCRDHRLSTF
jgi:hypothetical protein